MHKHLIAISSALANQTTYRARNRRWRYSVTFCYFSSLDRCRSKKDRRLTPTFTSARKNNEVYKRSIVVLENQTHLEQENKRLQPCANARVAYPRLHQGTRQTPRARVALMKATYPTAGHRSSRTSYAQHKDFSLNNVGCSAYSDAIFIALFIYLKGFALVFFNYIN